MKTKIIDENNLNIKKIKYWHRIDIDVCVICGKETKYRQRVYNESEKGTFFKDDVCWGHF